LQFPLSLPVAERDLIVVTGCDERQREEKLDVPFVLNELGVEAEPIIEVLIHLIVGLA